MLPTLEQKTTVFRRGTMISMASRIGPRVDWLTPLTIPIGDASVFIVFVEFAGNRPADFRPTVDSTIRSRGLFDNINHVVLILRISTGAKAVFRLCAGICRHMPAQSRKTVFAL